MLTFWKYFWLFFPLLEIILIDKYWGFSQPPDGASSPILLSRADGAAILHSYLHRTGHRTGEVTVPWETLGVGVGVSPQEGTLLVTKLFPPRLPGAWAGGRRCLLGPLSPAGQGGASSQHGHPPALTWPNTPCTSVLLAWNRGLQRHGELQRRGGVHAPTAPWSPGSLSRPLLPRVPTSRCHGSGVRVHVNFVSVPQLLAQSG